MRKTYNFSSATRNPYADQLWQQITQLASDLGIPYKALINPGLRSDYNLEPHGNRINVQPKSLSEITEQAIELLTKELGLVATLRFLNQFTTGCGNYTEEREALFKDLTVEDALPAKP
jgi:hypothetical protein